MSYSPCGIDCGACEEACGGCRETEGRAFWVGLYSDGDVCPKYDCAINKKGFNHCGQCPELPCKLYDDRNPSTPPEVHELNVKKRVELLRSL